MTKVVFTNDHRTPVTINGHAVWLIPVLGFRMLGYVRGGFHRSIGRIVPCYVKAFISIEADEYRLLGGRINRNRRRNIIYHLG